MNPLLTTIHQPCKDFATIAFHAMLERIAEPNLPPRTLTVSPILVVRESCGAICSVTQSKTGTANLNYWPDISEPPPVDCGWLLQIFSP
jgi:hypothetical protein